MIYYIYILYSYIMDSGYYREWTCFSCLLKLGFYWCKSWFSFIKLYNPKVHIAENICLLVTLMLLQKFKRKLSFICVEILLNILTSFWVISADWVSSAFSNQKDIWRLELTRNTARCNSWDDLTTLSFILKVSFFSEAYLEPSRTSIMKLFTKIADSR